MNTEQDAEKFWNEVNSLLRENQTDDPIHEYRFYYDETGEITDRISVVTNRPLPELPEGSYILVSREQYTTSDNMLVKSGILVKKDRSVDVKNGLSKSNSGFKVVKNNAALLLDDDDEYQNTEHYDRTNR